MSELRPRSRAVLGTLTLVLVAASDPASAQLTLRLTGVPAGMSEGSGIYVAGPFNRWHPASPAYRLTPQGGEYVLTLPDSVRGPVEFKFTRGSWETVETYTAGRDVPNRSVTVPASGAATYTGAVAAWRDPRKWPLANSTATKSVSVMSVDFAMPELGRTRRV